jgi:DNA helicase-2/ATP-dependent DNA helicase PcrA
MEINNLNSEQSKAVLHTDGPLLVLAGAGTGKTKVLTSRIIHIVNSYLASPFQILAVTFTNKAAAEMKKRIGEVIGDQVNNLWVGTFHSIAARILRRHPDIVGLRSDFTIIDDDDQTRLLKQIITDLDIDIKQFPAKFYLNKISRLKDKVTSANDLKFASDDLMLPKLKEVYQTYQYRLKSMNAADFGDLLLYNLEIFQNAPEILSYYQDKFKYILVDEYQDTNNAQYNWLLQLAAVHKNICAVGDDDQSIYSWRGANVANILRFEKDFTDAQVIRLEQNYRSTGNILKAASSVIAHNKERHGKTLWTKALSGDKIKVFSFPDDRAEALSVINFIKRATQASKFKFSQIAILVRAGYQTRQFEEAFIHNSLPYKVIGGMKFYERMEIRDAIAYLRVCANPSDDLALGRIINTPKRGVGEGAVANIYERSKQDRVTFFTAMKSSLEQDLIKGKARDSLKIFLNQIEKFHAQLETTSLADLARSILNESGYISMWRGENTLESQGRLENIEEFINSLSDFSTMTEFLEYVSLVEARDDASKQDVVTVMTVHGAKGLEFDLVFVPGLEDGIFPSAKSLENKNGVEEERRLMYVAITRAKKELILSYAKTRYVYGDYQMQAPSRFIKELPQDEIELEHIDSGFRSSNAPRMDFSQKDFGSKNNFSQKNNVSFGQKSFTTAAQYMTKPAASKSQVTDSLSNKRVFHQKFGYGAIISADGNKLEIQFEKAGKKVVMKDFVTAA